MRIQLPMASADLLVPGSGSDLESFDTANVVVHFKKSRSPEVCDVCHDGKHWVKNCSLVAEARELRQLRAGGAAGQMG